MTDFPITQQQKKISYSDPIDFAEQQRKQGGEL
jgi:hypothetical protein